MSTQRINTLNNEKSLTETLTNKLLLIYGENIGLIEDFKKKIKSIYSDSEVNNFNQANIIQNEEMFYSQIFNI